MHASPRSGAKDLMLRGTLITLRRKCGKPSCHCARGEPHATPALTYTAEGGKKMITLRVEDVPIVEAALARYRDALGELNGRALQGVALLREQIESRRMRNRARSR